MKKLRFVLPLCLLVLLAGLVWLNASPTALLDNDGVQPDGQEVLDVHIPLTEVPPAEPEDPFAQFTKEQLDTMNQVLELVNQARAEAGAAPLTLDPALCSAAQVRAAECVTTFSHTRPDGTSYKTAVAEAGVVSDYIGENVATGQKTVEKVMQSWLNSEGHRTNILNPNYTKIGIGSALNVGSRYKGYSWAQLFTD